MKYYIDNKECSIDELMDRIKIDSSEEDAKEILIEDLLDIVMQSDTYEELEDCLYEYFDNYTIEFKE